MKLKFLVKIIEKLLGMASTGDEPRADMYLPERLLAMAIVFLLAGVGAAAFAIYIGEWILAIVALIGGVALCTFALLCWKNQTIHVISDVEFTYTTMFGNKRTYMFSDIEWLRKNNDSLTLFVAGDKVHIESMAILSDRFVELVNKALENNSKGE